MLAFNKTPFGSVPVDQHNYMGVLSGIGDIDAVLWHVYWVTRCSEAIMLFTR